jgi:hypothetical protein
MQLPVANGTEELEVVSDTNDAQRNNSRSPQII